MPSRGGPFGLSGRRLHVCLLSFFLLTLLLWSHRHANSAERRDPVPLEGALYDHADSADLKEGLAKWEVPADRVGPSSASASASAAESNVPPAVLLPELENSREACRPTRPRDQAGHVTAYLIMVHSEATLEGARRLIEQIYDPHDYFLVHADKKLDPGVYERYKDAISVCGNVHFVPDDERVDIGWGDVTMIDAEITMLKRALRSPIAWTNMILLDGTSWPVLGAPRRQEWFDIFEEEVARGGDGQAPAPICTYGEEVVEFETDCWRTPARCLDAECRRMTKTPHNAAVRKGDQWTILTRSMVKYAIFGQDSQAWYDFFAETAVPDEHFFATIKYAQPGAPNGWLRTPMYVHWGPCRSHPVEKFEGHPCSLGMKDLDAIFSSVAMFARKVDLDEDDLRSTMLRGEPKAVELPLL
ncbi:hypothetical protein JCM11491_006696 [Sporobolomyces phaffii]